MQDVSLKEDYLEIEQFNIYFQEYMPAKKTSGQTLIFLHEGLGSVSSWKNFPHEICEKTGLRTLIYDRRGYGKSSAHSWVGNHRYLHEEAELYLPEFIKKTDAKNPILIGHSDGGSIALIFAGLFSDRPELVITEAAHVIIERLSMKGIKNAVESYDLHGLKEKLYIQHGKKTENIFRSWSRTWLDFEMAEWNIEEYLNKIKCPVLAIQGINDEYGTNSQLELISEQVEDSETLLLPNCGHIPHYDAREQVIKAIVNKIKNAAYNRN